MNIDIFSPAGRIAMLDCESELTDQEINANAQLIANAPHMRDTIRDLLEALCEALPYVEDHEGSDIYKTGAVARTLRTIRAAIKQAEATQ